MNEKNPLSNNPHNRIENSDLNNNSQLSNDNKPPYILDSKREQELMAMAEKNLAPKVSQFRNFFIEQEILQRQGFNSVISHQNLINTKKNLIAGFDYIKSHAKNTTEEFLKEESDYLDLKNSKTGIKKEEVILFKLITLHLTVQHASPMELALGDRLKSIRQREIEGETVTNQRTSRSKGRQNFIYGVTGLKEQINSPGLEGLHIYRIFLNKLALRNPNKFAQMYVSPHLTEFKKNTCITPIMMGETRIDARFDDKTKSIIYTFDRKKDKVFLEKTYHLHDFVFYGGEDIINGIALRFIELLRFIGNPYRQHLISCLSDPLHTEKQKIKQLGQTLTALMPGWMIIEAKFPKDIVLDAAYTEIIHPNQNNISHTSFDDYPNDDLVDNNNTVDDLTSIDGKDEAFFLKPLIDALVASSLEVSKKDFSFEQFIDDPSEDDDTEKPLQDKPVTHENERKENLTKLIKYISSEICSGLSGIYDKPKYTGYFPTDINLFFHKLILSEIEESIDLIKFILTTSFRSSHDEQLHYLFNINERNRTGTHDLFPELLGLGYRKKRVNKLLPIIYPYLHTTIFENNFCKYVDIAASGSYGEIPTSYTIEFLLEKNIPISPDNPYLLKWINFKNNEKLLEYMFIQQSFNINGVINGHSWLEHAILLQNENTIDWLIKNGATLHREHPKVVQTMTQDLKIKFNISLNENTAQDKSYPDAVVIIATAKYDNNDTYVIMGRRRVTNKLELQWSFPGGLVETDETALQAAIRELEEETTITVPSNTPVRELMRVPLHIQHQWENKINQLIFVHIDLGTHLLPSAWPGDDLGEIAKININRNKINQNRVYKDLPVRVSNDFLLDKLNDIEKSIDITDFSLLLFAEMYPKEFTWYFLNLLREIEGKDFLDLTSTFHYTDEYNLVKNDPHQLKKLQQKIMILITHYLLRINHKTFDPKLRTNIFSYILRYGQETLALSLIKNNFFNDSPIEISEYFNLKDLIISKHWSTLDVICTYAPSALKISEDRWNNVKDIIKNIPSQKTREFITDTNRANIILDKLKSIYKMSAKSKERIEVCNDVRNQLINNPELYHDLKEIHLKFILLSGDLDLFKSCYKLPQFKNFGFCSPGSYFFKPGTEYKRKNILNSLDKRGHKEMLEFLNKKFFGVPPFPKFGNDSDLDDSINDVNINSKN